MIAYSQFVCLEIHAVLSAFSLQCLNISTSPACLHASASWLCQRVLSGVQVYHVCFGSSSDVV